MNKHLVVMICIAYCIVQLSCEAREMNEIDVQPASDALAIQNKEKDLKQSIRDLIQSSKLDIKTAPEGLEELRAMEKRDISEGDVIAALSSVSPGETLVSPGKTLVVLSEGVDRWDGETQSFLVRLDHEIDLMDIGVIKERRIEPTKTDEVNDVGVAGSLRAFLLTLGVREEELGEADVRAFLSQEDEEESNTHKPILMVGKAAFFSRQLGGIPVMGDRIHLTVTPQGELDRIKGRWTSIDYAHSVLTAAISEEEILDRAVSALASSGIAVERKPDINIRMEYRIVNDENYGKIAMLKGVATIIYSSDPGVENSLDGSQSVEFDLE